MAEDKNLLDKLRDTAVATAEGLKRQYGIGANNNPWPQTEYQPILGLNSNRQTKGFLPSAKIEPINKEGEGGADGEGRINRFGNYEYKDWRGHLLNPAKEVDGLEHDKFKKSIRIPKSDDSLVDSPYSTRDFYAIFNDNTTDYFKHGLQVINGESGVLGSSPGTSFENNDPIIYGFEVIIDDISSPLLNGAIDDFLNNYSGVSEIAARRPVYEDFKKQFTKFFKTRGTVLERETDNASISKSRNSSSPELQTGQGIGITQPGKAAYMAYYLKKVGGLGNLAERNTATEKKYLVDYNKDVITLDFLEDTSQSVTTLAHLYKLLYWSKPNGKGIIPENLLRFNCDIIVSEIRNFKRVKKTLNSVQEGTPPQLEIVKDNVSRQVYSLRDCQLYFNGMPHPNDIDMTQTPSVYDSYSIQFDYKYTSNKLERFMPTPNGDGQYVGYDGGAIWKVGNKGATTAAGGNSILSSVPNFYTTDENTYNKTGTDGRFLLSRPENGRTERTFNPEDLDNLESFKRQSTSFGKRLKNRLEDVAIRSATRELQTFVNTRTAILNRTLNKIITANGIVGVRPPRNVYTDRPLSAGERIFYDVRGDLINFLGNAAGGALGGGGIIGGNPFSPR